MVDGSTSVDKQIPPRCLVVDGAATAFLPPSPPPPPPLALGPLMEKREMCFLQMAVLLHDHEENTVQSLHSFPLWS